MNHRFFKWAWDHHGRLYSWLVFAHGYVVGLPIYVFIACCIVASERTQRAGPLVHYPVAAAVAAAFWLLIVAVAAQPGAGPWPLIQRWGSGEDVHPRVVLAATYAWGRRSMIRALVTVALGATLMAGCIAAMSAASSPKMIQYGVWGGVIGVASHLIGVHTVAEAPMRPIRIAIGATGIGDVMPRPRPSFATWSDLAVLAAALAFSTGGAMVAAIAGSVAQAPLIATIIGVIFTLGFGAPITVGVAFAPSLLPIQDLADGTKRVAAGDYGQRLPVFQDDDLGVLSASFNRMQAGLAERQRLAAAFGTYVDPALAARLLEQGDDVFTGERREVTVMFIDIRDFTPFAEANTAEATVARLNELFEIVVPAVVDAGGHVNKFLGDGALAVFGAPNDLADHADAAVRAAVAIQRRVAQHFGDDLRIGIGVNTGPVIAGTIGGAGKLEFTLIGDTVNVAARVEQLTKFTGDTVLLTLQCVDAMAAPPGLIDRGLHELKGKSAAVQVFGISPRIHQGH